MSLGRVTAIECLTGVGVLLTAAFAKDYIYIRESPGQLSSFRIKIRVGINYYSETFVIDHM